jgi:ribose transport system substrate-binding protein
MIKTLKWILACAFAFLPLTLSTSCKKQTTSEPESAKQTHGTIGLSLLTLTNPFFITIGVSMKAEAAKYNYDVIIVSGELDPAKQNDQIKDFIVKKVSAIVLTPCDSESLGQAIKQANDAGIPVFTADIACTAKDAKVISHIATDNYLGGRLAGKAVMRALNNKGKLAIVTHPTVESAILRCKGFKDELIEAQSKIDVVGTWTGMGDREESFKVAQEILQAHPDLNGFFCVNDPSALGVFAAVEKAQKTNQIRIVGFDGQPEGKKAIKDGKIFGDPVQFPDRIGKITVQTIMKYFEGAKVEPQILIPPELYFQADADKDPSLKED